MCLFLSIAFAFDTRVDNTIGLKVASSSSGGISFELSGIESAFKVVETGRDGFLRIELPGSYPSRRVGAPEMPVYRALVQIPFGAEPEIIINKLVLKEQNLSDFDVAGRIAPRMGPWVKLPGYEPPFEMDETVYSSDAYRFASRVEIIDITTARSYRLALIEVVPIDYNPVRNTLSIVDELEFEVVFRGGDLAITQEVKSRYGNRYYDAVVEPSLANPDAFSVAPKWLPPTTQLGYLIVAADAYIDTAMILADWKFLKGYSVKIRTVSELGGTANSIRDWIIADYDSAAVAPVFVLLVGDFDEVPSFEGNESESETDTPYGDMDATGYIPELFVGRISPENPSQLADFIRRNIAYEKFDFPTAHMDFANKATFLGSDDGSWWELAESTQRYVIGEHFAPAGLDCDSIWAHSDPSSGDNSRTAAEDGRTILSYTGHGGYYSWSAPSWSADDVRDLGNEFEYPFVISNACITGTFHLAECFGETWMRQEDAGAIGFIGASNNSYWDEDDIMERVMFDDVFEADYRFAGGMLNRGLLGVYIAYPSNSEYYYDEYNLLGDPSLAIWFGDPSELVAVYPPTLSVGGVVSVNVTSGGAVVDSAMVCATNGSTVHSVGYTDAFGNIDLSVVGAGMDDTIFITVSVYDMVPHVGFAIIGSGGPWLMMDSISIDDSAGDGDGAADIGESIGLTVWLRNIGGEDAASVVGLLRSDEIAVGIVDSTGNFGTIVEGGRGANVPPFAFDLSSAISDGEVMDFMIFAEDAVDSSWDIPVGVIVNAPDMCLASHELSDSIGGDGDGFFEPGETARLSVDIFNDGGETARFITVSLSVETNPHVVVGVASSGIDSILPGGTRTNSPSFELSADASCPTPYMIEAYITAQDFRGPSCVDTIILTVGTAGLYDDCESGIGGWVSGGVWHISDHRFASPGHSWYSGVEDYFLYTDSLDAELISPVVSTPVDAVLTFSHYFNTEYEYDPCYVSYSTDGGGSWSEIGEFSGPSGMWQLARFDLSSVLAPGTPVMLKFTLSADVYCGGEGWYIDDISFSSPSVANVGAGGVEPFAGNGSTDFRFVVTCRAQDGVVPSAARVVIDGTVHNLTLADGSLATGALFDYNTTLAPGDYSYHYEFIFGGVTVRFPDSGEIAGPFVSSGLYTLDVGSSESGITHYGYGPMDDWEYGAPSTGPSSVPIGTNCWATNLDGNYSDSSRSRLVLPPMSLAGLDGAFLCFYHWYRFQSATGFSFHDGGNIKIAVDGSADTFLVHPQFGYDGNASQYNHFVDWENVYGGNDNGNFWQFEAIDLSPWVGHSVTVSFDFGSSSRNVEAGWFINNIYLFESESHGIGASSGKLPEALSIKTSPNPFNAAMRIEIDAPSDETSLYVFDISGRRVDELSDRIERGKNTLLWEPQDLPSGIYFIRVVCDDVSTTEPVILLK